MPTLADLSPTDPSNAENVSLGASRIRTIVSALLTTFGLEMYLTGEHKIPSGAPGVRPTVGKLGHLFVDTTNKRVEMDDGAAWRMLNAVQVYRAFTAAPITISDAGAYNAIQSLNADIPQGARALMVSMFTVGSLVSGGKYQFRIGSNVARADSRFDGDPTLSNPFTVMDVVTPTSAGPLVPIIEMRKTSANFVISDRLLLVFVL